MSKTLITSFEPFGLVGKFVRAENASHTVMDLVRARMGEENCTYLTLPVDKTAQALLQETLEREKPSAILAMGEHLFASPNMIKIEPYAIDTAPGALPNFAAQFKKRIPSDFVSTLPTDPNGGKSDTSSLIGTYYCNDVYRTALKWAQENGNAPTAFVHVPVIGDEKKHAKQVLWLLDRLQQDAANTLTAEF